MSCIAHPIGLGHAATPRGRSPARRPLLRGGPHYARVRVGGTETYHPFVAEGRREDEMLKSFLDFMSGQSDYTIYHWHHYEKTHLRSMMGRHGMEAYRLLDPDVLFDLYPIATNAFAFPTYSNSIKDIAKWLGFKWRHDNVVATSAIEMYLKYEDPGPNQDGMQMVLDYNEDDCVATRAIKDWLVAVRQSMLCLCGATGW